MKTDEQDTSPATAAPDPNAMGAAQLAAENQQLRQELAAARAEIAKRDAEKDAITEEQKLINAKVRMGLTEAQATAVVRRQRAFDESDFGKSQRARHGARQMFKSGTI